MAATISEEEKARARHHLGYLQVEAAQTFVLGVPAAVETQFMIEGALNVLLESSVNKFRSLLCQLDAVESEVFCGIDLASVDRIDTITVSPKRLSELAKYYLLAQQALANLLGIVPNPWDQRMWLQTAYGGVNVPVM